MLSGLFTLRLCSGHAFHFIYSVFSVLSVVNIGLTEASVSATGRNFSRLLSGFVLCQVLLIKCITDAYRNPGKRGVRCQVFSHLTSHISYLISIKTGLTEGSASATGRNPTKSAGCSAGTSLSTNSLTVLLG